MSKEAWETEEGRIIFRRGGEGSAKGERGNFMNFVLKDDQQLGLMVEQVACSKPLCGMEEQREV